MTKLAFLKQMKTEYISDTQVLVSKKLSMENRRSRLRVVNRHKEAREINEEIIVLNDKLNRMDDQLFDIQWEMSIIEIIEGGDQII